MLKIIEDIIQWDKNYIKIKEDANNFGVKQHCDFYFPSIQTKTTFVDDNIVYKVYPKSYYEKKLGIKEIIHLCDLDEILLKEQLFYNGESLFITTSKKIIPITSIEILSFEDRIKYNEIPSLGAGLLNTIDMQWLKQLGIDKYLKLRKVLIMFNVVDFSFNTGTIPETNEIICYDLEFHNRINLKDFHNLFSEDIKISIHSNIWAVLRS